jgi:hypothetical protein
MDTPVAVALKWEDWKLAALPESGQYVSVAKFPEDAESWPREAWSIVIHLSQQDSAPAERRQLRCSREALIYPCRPRWRAAHSAAMMPARAGQGSGLNTVLLEKRRAQEFIPLRPRWWWAPASGRSHLGCEVGRGAAPSLLVERRVR